MPELPEVETVRRLLEPRIKQKQIGDISILDQRIVHLDPTLFHQYLVTGKVEKIDRKGKYLLLYISTGYVLISHLRMEGRYFLLQENEDLPAHTRVIFTFTDHTRLIYADSRRFGTMDVVKTGEEMNFPSLKALAKEPFDYQEESFFAILQQKKQDIKTVLLDQHVIAGLGNIYCDEALFAAKISPFLPACQLTRTQSDSLLQWSRKILLKAIEQGGSTVDSYHPLNQIDGRFQNSLNAYGRSGFPCIHCQTLLRKTQWHGRGTTYCPTCQGVALRVGIYGKIASGKSTFLSFFQKDDYPTFSCDAEIHKMYLHDKAFHAFLMQHFSSQAFNDQGKVEKQWIKQVVNNNPVYKKLLEDYLQPRVQQEAHSFLATHRSASVVALEVPLLFECKWENMFDCIIAIDAPLDVQIANLKRRKSHQLEQDLLLNQTSAFDQNKKRCDFVITNVGSIADLQKQYADLMRALLPHKKR